MFPMPFYYQRSFLVAALSLDWNLLMFCENMMEVSEFGARSLPFQEERASLSTTVKNTDLDLQCPWHFSAPSFPFLAWVCPPGAWLPASCQLILAKVLGGKGSRVINPCRSFSHSTKFCY
jgi:hypothetical protein